MRRNSGEIFHFEAVALANGDTPRLAQPCGPDECRLERARTLEVQDLGAFLIGRVSIRKSVVCEQ